MEGEALQHTKFVGFFFAIDDNSSFPTVIFQSFLAHNFPNYIAEARNILDWAYTLY